MKKTLASIAVAVLAFTGVGPGATSASAAFCGPTTKCSRVNSVGGTYQVRWPSGVTHSISPYTAQPADTTETLLVKSATQWCTIWIRSVAKTGGVWHTLPKTVQSDPSSVRTNCG